ncbi:MAG: phosphate ABC transporter substrate-binding protein [Phormidesmis sp.]
MSACSPAPSERQQLVLTGSSTVAPLIAEIAERYQTDHPDVVFDIQTGGSNKGAEDVRAGLNDIGMMSRSLNPDETDLTTFTIAQDGISILLNQSAVVNTLERQQIIDIFTGKVTNWQQVGGNDAPIQVLSKNVNHATVGLFAKYFELEPEQIVATQLVGDNEEVIETVLGNPAAIGYVSVGAAEYKIVHGMPLKLMSLEGIAATIRKVSQGVFPLSRPLNLVTAKAPEGLEKDFIEFSCSSAVEDIIQAQAFVPTSVAD